MLVSGEGPHALDLTAAQVATIQVASDEARAGWAEIIARDPSVKAAMDGLHADEKTACIHRVRDAYLAAGVSEERATQASESWMIAKRGVVGDLELADEWLEESRLSPRSGPGGLGRRREDSKRHGD